MIKLLVKKDVVIKTIELLQIAGRSSVERMVLWFGQRQNNTVIVKELFLPKQDTSRVSIHISQVGLKEIYDKIRTNRFMIAAQIHSHPKEAFHSYADDCLALPKHEGAISLVLPNFALHTNIDSFVTDLVCYKLSKDDVWECVNVSDNLEIL